jgi:hypothetical protein
MGSDRPFLSAIVWFSSGRVWFEGEGAVVSVMMSFVSLDVYQTKVKAPEELGKYHGQRMEEG